MTPRMRPIVDPLILSVSGRDRPGVLAAIARALDSAGIDVVDIEQATLQDFLALSFLLDLRDDPERSQRLLRDILPEIAALGLAVDVRALDATQVHLLKETEQIVVTLVSETPSARVVADLASVLARHNANIVTIRRLAEEDLRAGEYVVDVTGVADVAALKADVLVAAEHAGVDVGIAQENVHRKSKRVIVFDMDNTLIADEVIDLLAARHGVLETVSALTARAMAGELDFKQALRERVALLAGMPASVLDQVVAEVRLTPGAEQAIAVLKRLGYRMGILSGGFTFVVDAFRERLGLDYGFANTLEIVDGRLTGRVLDPILDGAGKAEKLRLIAHQEGVPLDQVVGIGDGANDIPMLQAAGLGIAFRAKETTRRSADAAIQRNDFTGLLYLLGITGRDLRRVREQ